MRNLLRAQLAIQAAQFVLFRLGERAPIRAIGEPQHRVQVRRLRVHQTVAERGGALFDRLAHWLENAWIGVLRGVLPELLEDIDERESVPGHIVQLVPEPVEPGGLGVVEHEAQEVMVLAIEKRERDDFIDRHDLRVAKRRRENLAELVERGLDALAGRAAVIHDDGGAVRGGAVV